MLLRGDPDASPTPDKVQAQHISTCVSPPPVACPQLPPPHAPQGFFINGFFIVVQGAEKRYAAARGDPDASPTPDKVRSAAKAALT